MKVLITGISGSTSRAAARMSIPLTPGMRTSVSTMSGVLDFIASRPALPPWAVSGLKPEFLRRILSVSRIRWGLPLLILH